MFGGNSYEEEVPREIPIHILLKGEDEMMQWMIDQKIIQNQIPSAMYSIQCGRRCIQDKRFDYSELPKLYEESNGTDLVLYIIRKVPIYVDSERQIIAYIMADEFNMEGGELYDFKLTLEVKAFDNQREQVQMDFSVFAEIHKGQDLTYKEEITQANFR